MLIFKNEQEVRILSKIITEDTVVIKNDTFLKLDLSNDKKIELFINRLKIIYEDTWKEKNQINRSIKLPLIVRVDHTSSYQLIGFEKILNELDLVSYYAIDKLDKNHTFYKIIFNGSSSNFINIMKNKNYLFDTQKKIWILK